MRMLLMFLIIGCAWGQVHGDIMGVLHHYRMTTLISYIKTAGLEATLKGIGPLTLFAPSNSAFRKLSSHTSARMHNDTAVLKAILKYHIVSGSIPTSDLHVNEKLIPSMEGHSIRINHYLYNGHMSAEGARVYRAGLTATNGIVHELSGVMIPPVGTIVDVIANDPDLSTLKQVVQSAGLTTFLQEQHPITMFAPTNKAFQTLGNSVIQGLIQQPALLTTLLRYHVVPGSLWSTDFHEQMLETFDEEDRMKLHRLFLFGYEVDHAHVMKQDISATNGVVHKIRTVIIPSSIADKVKSLATTSSPPP